MREICDKYLPKESIINKNWRKNILDNDITPTFYKRRRLVWEGVLHQHSLPVADRVTGVFHRHFLLEGDPQCVNNRFCFVDAVASVNKVFL